jgi:hypothetical protein
MHARSTLIPLVASLGLGASAEAVILDITAPPFTFVVAPCDENFCPRSNVPPLGVYDLSSADEVTVQPPAGTRAGPFALTAQANTDTLLVESFAISNAPTTFLITARHDYGQVTATIDPDGFDPAYEATFDITLEATMTFSLVLDQPFAVPIHPDTLMTNVFTPFAIVEETELTFFIDGTPVFFEDSSRYNHEMRIVFTEDPEPAVSQIQFQEVPYFGVRDLLIATVGQGISAYVGDPAHVANDDMENPIAGPVNVSLPEPATSALLLAGLGLAWKRRAAQLA